MSTQLIEGLTDEFLFKGFLFNYKKSFKFIKYFIISFPEMKNKIHKGYVLKLLDLIKYNTNALGRFDKQGVFKPFPTKHIIKHLDLSRSTFYAFRKECIELGILARIKIDEQEMYILNPAYFSYGSQVDFLTYMVFSSNEDFLRGVSDEIKEKMDILVSDYLSKHQLEILDK